MSELIDVISAGFEPRGDDYRWGFQVCWEGGRSGDGFVWPSSGPVVAEGVADVFSRSPHPSWVGDGICLATTWGGVAPGGLPATLFLLAGYRSDDVLGADADRVRVRAATVVATWSAADFVRRLLPAGGVLDSAYLRSANLHGVDFRGANLGGADLAYADLAYTNLFNVDLSGAHLSGARLINANLSGADLSGADLCGAYLRGADLSGANLTGALLINANLTDANLRWANLRTADLSGTNLSGAVI